MQGTESVPVSQVAATDPTLVKIDSGNVRGVAAGSVVGLRGIPYAAPPVGDLRWGVTQPVRPWSDVLQTENFGPACLQTDRIPKSENCQASQDGRHAAVSINILDN